MRLQHTSLMEMPPAGPFESAETTRARTDALERLRLLDTEPEEEFDELVKLAGDICGTPVSLLTLLDTERQFHKSHIGTDVREVPLHMSFCRYTLQADALFVVPDMVNDARFRQNPAVTGDPHIRFYAGVPLVVDLNTAVGALCVVDTVPRTLTDAQTRALEVLGRQLSAQLRMRAREAAMQSIQDELEEANRKLRALALTDDMTNLWNRRAFDARLETEVYRAHSTAHPLGLLMIDVDDFKQLNDDHGHSHGDQVLAMVAALLRRVVREKDMAARFGGEEFALILPDSEVDDARVVCDRLNRELKSAAWAKRAVTVSIGIAMCLPGSTADDLLNMADDAMYRAKRSGKNCVVAYEVEDAGGSAREPLAHPG